MTTMRETEATPDARSAPDAAPGVELDSAVLLRVWWRIGVAAVVAGQSMVASLAINLTPPEGATYWVLHGVLIAAALGVCALLLPTLVREAWSALRVGRISVEQLFLVTLLGAFAASFAATLTRTGAVYYEVISILLAIYSAGKTLGARSRAQALRAVDETRERYEFAERLDGARVPVQALNLGERVRVRPGAAICVDGVVRAGRSFVQETAMTGEWRPIARGPGDHVLAGTHTIDGELEIDVTAAVGTRRLDAVLAEVRAARLAPSELQLQADRLAARFLPLVLAVSAGTFAFWTWRAGWIQGVFNSMAVLLVACPCALGLATPLAVWQGLGALGRLGLVARTGDVIDVLARTDHVCFDKTGTLSAESLTVLDWRQETTSATSPAWTRAAVAAVERGLEHPVARALVAVAWPGDPEVRKDAGRIEPGLGVRAQVDGRELQIGAPAWTGFPSAPGEARLVGVAVDGVPTALITLGEAWRAGAAEVFAELARRGVAAEILTGDSTAPAFPGVRWSGGLRPDEKRARVEALRREGRVTVFLGDGINDAAALSAADCAIAMGGGAPLARASAPAVFLGDDLRFLPRAIVTARAVRSRIASNLRLAATYNTVAMAVAAAGWLHPVGAALLMLGSSAVVSARALQVGRTVDDDPVLPVSPNAC
ncbi:MAG: heavy metal translocating P-type ATPase [Opitutaceae bacterium]